jgi:hypothetical protein
MSSAPLEQFWIFVVKVLIASIQLNVIDHLKKPAEFIHGPLFLGSQGVADRYKGNV